MKRLLVTGASGFLGWNICRQAGPDWEVFGTYFSHPTAIPESSMMRVDLTRFKDLKRLFASVRRDALIHAAAAAKPDFCQKNQAASYKINTDASINIAGLCAGMKIPCRQKALDLPAPRPPDLSFDISKAESLGFEPHRLTGELKRLI